MIAIKIIRTIFGQKLHRADIFVAHCFVHALKNSLSQSLIPNTVALIAALIASLDGEKFTHFIIETSLLSPSSELKLQQLSLLRRCRRIPRPSPSSKINPQILETCTVRKSIKLTLEGYIIARQFPAHIATLSNRFNFGKRRDLSRLPLTLYKVLDLDSLFGDSPVRNRTNLK